MATIELDDELIHRLDSTLERIGRPRDEYIAYLIQANLTKLDSEVLTKSSPQERGDRLREWIAKHSVKGPQPSLTDEELRRANMYDG